MSIIANSLFKANYPGPYDIRPSTDGVDDTFEVYCLVTDQCIVSTNYWYERDQAYREAHAVATALNTYLFDAIVTEKDRQQLAEFLSSYDRLFRIDQGSCEYRGHYYSVACNQSGNSIVDCYGPEFHYETLCTARTIADSLSFSIMTLPRIGRSSQQDSEVDGYEPLNF